MPAYVPHCQNPLYLFCGNVPYMLELVWSFVEMAVPACLPMCFTFKIQYIYFMALYLICGSSFIHLLKYPCLSACLCAPQYLFCGNVSDLWELVCKFFNGCACVPAHVSHFQNQLYIFFDTVPDLWGLFNSFFF